MKSIQRLALSASLLVFSTSSLQAAALTSEEYKAGKNRISSDYKFDYAACATMKSNAKDICHIQAKGKKNDAEAALTYANTGKEKDANKLRKVKADSAYSIAKEVCDDRTGNDKDVCRAEAKRNHTDALADNTMIKKVGAAEMKDAEQKQDSSYAVAIEKCDALSGDGKDACVRAAKIQANKL